MNDKEFTDLLLQLDDYLSREKVFIKNPARVNDVKRAMEIATELFHDSKVYISDDPIQMGALIIRIEGFDVTIRGQREIKLFQELIDKADNFEIYPIGEEEVKFSILFEHALIRLPQGK